jgi:hypothetical protein
MNSLTEKLELNEPEQGEELQNDRIRVPLLLLGRNCGPNSAVFYTLLRYFWTGKNATGVLLFIQKVKKE